MMKIPARKEFSFLKPSRRWLTPLGAAALLVFAVALPLGVDLAENWLNLLYSICLGIAMGQSWNMLGGFAGQTSLGHAAFFGIGALLARTLWFAGVPFVLAFIVGGMAAAMFAMIIGAPTFRLRGAYFAIGTLAVAEAMRITIGQNLPYFSRMSGEMIASYDLAARYWVALILAIATTVAAFLLLRSRWSLGILGVREDEAAAEASGVHVLRHKLLALALSALFMGFAGAVFAFKEVTYYPENPFYPTWTFHALMIAYIGGLGTVAGPVIGGIFFVVVRERLATSLPYVHQVIFGALFIVVVLLLPGGLMQIWSYMKKWSGQLWSRMEAGGTRRAEVNGRRRRGAG